MTIAIFDISLRTPQVGQYKSSIALCNALFVCVELPKDEMYMGIHRVLRKNAGNSTQLRPEKKAKN